MSSLELELVSELWKDFVDLVDLEHEYLDSRGLELASSEDVLISRIVEQDLWISDPHVRGRPRSTSLCFSFCRRCFIVVAALLLYLNHICIARRLRVDLVALSQRRRWHNVNESFSISFSHHSLNLIRLYMCDSSKISFKQNLLCHVIYFVSVDLVNLNMLIIRVASLWCRDLTNIFSKLFRIRDALLETN